MPSGPGYLRVACDYVHWNPVRARLLDPATPLKSWRWSSYGDYLRPRRQRVRWLRSDRLLGEHGVCDDARGRRRFAQNMEAGRAEDAGEQQAPDLRRGWLLGGGDFLERVLERVTLSPKAHHASSQRAENAAALAARLIRQALAEEGLGESDLRRLRKGAPVKVRIARRLREQTTLSLQEIAARLHMGTAGHVAHLLYHRNDEK